MSRKKLRYYFNKISWYSIYVDCFTRIISEMRMNGEDNYAPSDFPNMILLLEKYAKSLRKNVSETENLLEFEQ